jgi:3D (Asp-Asp-Asp) domain-containing protein
MAWYNYGKYYLLKQNDASSSIDLLTHTIKASLMTSTYAQDIDADVFWDDISSQELNATGYTADGETLGSKQITADLTNDRAEFDAANTAFTSIGGTIDDTIGSVVIWRDTGTPGTSPLIAWADLTNHLTDGGSVTLVWNAEGILQLS